MEIKGAKGLAQKLETLPQKYGRKVVRGALRSGAKIIANRTKALAPVSGGRTRTRFTGSKSKRRATTKHMPGYMKKSIVVRAGKRNRPGTYAMLQMFDTARFPDLIYQTKRKYRTYRSRRKGERVTRAFKGGARSRRYFYPAAVEYGHRGAKPHSFIRPAFKTSSPVAQARIIRMLKAGVLREARRRTG